MNDTEDKAKTLMTVGSASITVTAVSPNQEQVLIYPIDESSAVIADSVIAELGNDLPTLKAEQVEEKVEYVKTRLDEIEISANLQEGFKLKFKLSPKQIIKSFTKKSLS